MLADDNPGYLWNYNANANTTVTIDPANVSIANLNNAKSNVTVSAGSSTLNVSGSWANTGIFTPGTGTVVFGGTTAITGSGTNSFNNLTITGAFTAPAVNMNVAGNWSNTGTFSANSGTITFTGTNQKIFGNTTFNNLTKDVSSASADTLMFQNGDTQTIGGTLTLTGGANSMLTLRSCDANGTESDGTQWLINPQGTKTINYLDVKDSDNTNSTVIDASGLSVANSGNNTNWKFTAIPGWTAPAATPSATPAATPTPTPSATPAVVPGQIPTTPTSVQLPTQSQILDFVNQSLKNIKSLIPQTPPTFTQPTTNPPSNLQPNQPPPTQSSTPAASNQIIVIQVLQKLLKALTDLLNAVFK
jgi:hypothetical protein